MELQQTLAKFGCTDFEETMKRFLDDEEFYQEILIQMLDDDGFAALEKPLLEKNTTSGFEIAHSLKGIIGNCGITPMYETICAIVEPLRTGSAEDLLPLYTHLMEQRTQLKAMLGC